MHWTGWISRASSPVRPLPLPPLIYTRHSSPWGLAVILSLHRPSGVFAGDAFGETDTRFLYCAVSALSLLGSLSALSKDARQRTIDYVVQCKNFDGGFGNRIGAESHAGQGALQRAMYLQGTRG